MESNAEKMGVFRKLYIECNQIVHKSELHETEWECFMESNGGYMHGCVQRDALDADYKMKTTSCQRLLGGNIMLKLIMV